MRRLRTNNYIRAPELRVIDDTGKNLGILPTDEALRIAQDEGLDLIEIAPTATPPVAKIMEYGKFLYQEKKKEKEGRRGQKSELKQVRFTVRTSGNDLTLRAKQVDKFLQKRHKVRILMVLRGREKALRDFANMRLKNFLPLITESYKVEQELKHSPMGLFMVISKS